jgi:hypothetical protein
MDDVYNNDNINNNNNDNIQLIRNYFKIITFIISLKNTNK